MSELPAYIDAVFTHWLWLMGAGPFLLDRLVSWISSAGSPWHQAAAKMREAALWIMAAALLIAGFLAWRDEYRKSAHIQPRSLTATESLCITDEMKPVKADFQYLRIAKPRMKIHHSMQQIFMRR